MNEKPTPTRGRPKTLDRDQVLQAALMEYWSKGPTDVSISDICGLTGTSKPGVYREFGSDDGLKASVLETYHRLAILPLIDILEKDQSTIDAIDALISFMTQDRTNLGVPQGCLFVMMRAEAQQLGPSTCAKLHEVRRQLLDAYEAWITCSKSRGDFADIPTDVAALFMDAQHGGAMRMQREGVPNDTVVSVLGTALHMLVLGEKPDVITH
ncbi:MAG: TetR/AcrR family transcriptional regulator [Rhodobacterales bacterium]|jgi:AcrR family transcriptional regulator|tara:strand:+ start:154 stop:786 length:633 start_codon:yes stop_codon:yes gene_type:complete